MFVTCGNCDAEYELDDAKIPASGARLRCTNCKHSFVVTPPEASDFQSADDLAYDALSAPPDPESEREALPEEEPDPDGEADWQFNEEIASATPEAGGDASELTLDASESPFDHGRDELTELSLAEEVVDDLLGPGGPVAADAAAAVDELLGEVDRVDSQWGESDRDLRSDLDAPGEALDLGDAPGVEPPDAGPAADASDAFDDLADWELFDPAAKTGGSAPSAGSNFPSAAATRDGARAEPRVKIAVAMANPSSTAVRWTDRVSQVVGWAAVLVLTSVSLVGGLASHTSDARVAAGRWSGAGFEADQIIGRWVDNAVVGSVYVVSGRLRRAPGSGRASQKALGIRLIDAKGREINRPPIWLAPAVPERVLRESSPAEIDAFQQRRAGRVAGVGERWTPFEVMLVGLPRSAGRFEFQALDR